MIRVGGLIINVWVLLLLSACVNSEPYNDTETFGDLVSVLSKDGQQVLIDKYLMQILNDEENTWHWIPWLRTRTEVHDGVVTMSDCGSRDSVESFPDSIFTDEQLRQGAFVLYLMFGIYAFTLLAVICNDYFIPSVELICEDLKIPQNIAAATFMSVATSCPEFFVNVISTFVMDSDMGIGTIVGSAIFNLLGVAAVGSLAAVKAIPIEMRPVTRDVVIYMINVAVLVTIVWDGQIEWYEATVLGVMYILYFVFMFNSVRVFRLIDKIIASCCKKNPNDNVEGGLDNAAYNHSSISVVSPYEEKVETFEKDEPAKRPKSLFRFPKENSLAYRIWWVYSWPLKCILSVTVPSPVTNRRFYPLTFIMCIVWIGGNSYFVSWSMTVLGHTFFIPESVMGMTFLAFGGCLPEAISIFIMSRRGEGGIGVSNALGANSLAILFALGVPWLIKCITLIAQGADQTFILLDSSGIDFIVGSLLVAASLLWLILFIGKFELKRSIGFIFAILYVIFITFAILVELGIIFSDSVMRCLY